MALKKLRGKHVIEVDPQILRWRQRLRKEGLVLGRAMASNKRRVSARKEDREIERNGGLKTKRWF